MRFVEVPEGAEPPAGIPVISVRNGTKRVALIPQATQPTLAIFPALALLNHSCSPIAAPHFGHVPTPGRLAALTAAVKLSTGSTATAGANPASVTAGTSVTAQEAGSVLSGEAPVSLFCVVTAARDVAPGEEITFNYVPMVSTDGMEYLPWLPMFRRGMTKATHGFVCVCPRCTLESGPAIPAQLTTKVGPDTAAAVRAKVQQHDKQRPKITRNEPIFEYIF